MFSETQYARGGTPGKQLPEHLWSDVGKLSMLAAACPLHRQRAAGSLLKLLWPPMSLRQYRIYNDGAGRPVATLIWAHLSRGVFEDLLSGKPPSSTADWHSGPFLVLMDIIAPFGHGRAVARSIARNPPAQRFYFLRVGADGKIRKVVMGDRNQGRRGLVHALDPQDVFGRR